MGGRARGRLSRAGVFAGSGPYRLLRRNRTFLFAIATPKVGHAYRAHVAIGARRDPQGASRSPSGSDDPPCRVDCEISRYRSQETLADDGRDARPFEPFEIGEDSRSDGLEGSSGRLGTVRVRTRARHASRDGAWGRPLFPPRNCHVATTFAPLQRPRVYPLHVRIGPTGERFRPTGDPLRARIPPTDAGSRPTACADLTHTSAFSTRSRVIAA